MCFQKKEIEPDDAGLLRSRSIDADGSNSGIGRSISWGDLINRTELLEAKFQNLHSKFLTFGTNLTQQLQRQEDRASLSWVRFKLSIVPTN